VQRLPAAPSNGNTSETAPKAARKRRSKAGEPTAAAPVRVHGETTADGMPKPDERTVADLVRRGWFASEAAAVAVLTRRKSTTSRYPFESAGPAADWLEEKLACVPAKDGVSAVARAITNKPELLVRSVERLQRGWDMLLSPIADGGLGYTPDRAASRVATHAALLNFTRTHVAKIAAVLEACGIAVGTKAIAAYPVLLNLKEETLLDHAAWWRQTGLDYKKILTAHPVLLCLRSDESRNYVQEKLDFLRDVAGMSVDELNKAGVLFCLSLVDRLRPRFFYARLLGNAYTCSMATLLGEVEASYLALAHGRINGRVNRASAAELERYKRRIESPRFAAWCAGVEAKLVSARGNGTLLTRLSKGRAAADAAAVAEAAPATVQRRSAAPSNGNTPESAPKQVQQALETMPLLAPKPVRKRRAKAMGKPGETTADGRPKPDERTVADLVRRGWFKSEAAAVAVLTRAKATSSRYPFHTAGPVADWLAEKMACVPAKDGVSAAARTISKSPGVLGRSVEGLQRGWDMLLSPIADGGLGYTPERAAGRVATHVSLLNYTQEHVKRTAAVLEACGVAVGTKAIAGYPFLLDLKEETLLDHAAWWRQTGLDYKKILTAHPALLNRSSEGSHKHLQDKFDFLRFVAGMSVSELNKAGVLFCMSLEERLRPRFFYARLRGTVYTCGMVTLLGEVDASYLASALGRSNGRANRASAAELERYKRRIELLRFAAWCAGVEARIHAKRQ
jgi:hypothetical protein